MWLAGNLGGLVVAAVVGVLVGEPLLAFLLLAVLSLLTLPLLRSFSRVSTSESARSPTA
jgi:membrane protein implicated in regulation of membrane protease activity